MNSELKIITHYECYVLDPDYSYNCFYARGVCVTDSNEPDLDIAFPLICVSQSDIELVKTGAIFDWKIFEDDSQSLVFRQDRWTKEEIEQAEIEAAKLFEMFGNENIK
jgi:hypothetical protein